MSQYDDNLRNLYYYGRSHDNSRAVVQRFNIYRTNEEFKEFIFVEGKSDETFYQNTSIPILRDKSKYLFADYDRNPKAEIGKMAVCSAFEIIRKNEELRYELDRCLFIIDKDYEFYKKNTVFTITDGHSMECYFLNRENIDIIFSHYRLTKEEAIEFWKMYEDFADKCYEFYALKGTVTYMYKENEKYKGAGLVKKGYVDRYNYRQIFRFIFDEGSYSFCEDMLNEELELLRETIKANKNFIPYYQKLYAEIKNKPSMVRGHDAFEFLKQYLRQVHGIIIEDNLHELVPVIGEFSIALDIKLIENVL